jgi:hypothetical protein
MRTASSTILATLTATDIITRMSTSIAGTRMHMGARSLRFAK